VTYPHTVTAHPSIDTTDADGNVVRRPAPTGVTVAAYVQPARTGENAAEPQTTTAEFVAYLAADCPPLDAWSSLVWDGAAYDLVGEAQRFDSPDRTITYWRARIRRH
jgi:hypothetical protein